MYNIHKILKILLINAYIVLFVKNFSVGIFSIISIFIHELSHVIILKIENIKNIKFSVLGFSIDLFQDKIIGNINLVYASGSISNIILGILLFILNLLFNNIYLYQFMVVNFVLGFINFIPIFPLDGAIILKNLLYIKINRNIVFIMSIAISFFMSIIFLIFGLYIMIKFSIFNLSWIVVSLFLFISTYNEYKYSLKLQRINTVDNRKYILKQKKYLKTIVISVSYNEKLLNIIKMFRYGKFIVIYFLNENLEIVKIMNEFNVLECYKKYGNVCIKNILNEY